MFINAKHEITRKNSQSYLEPEHIQKIADAYAVFEPIDGFATVATIEEIATKDYSLGIPQYVAGDVATPYSREQVDEAITKWLHSTADMHAAYSKLTDMIEEGGAVNA